MHCGFRMYARVYRKLGNKSGHMDETYVFNASISFVALSGLAYSPPNIVQGESPETTPID